MLRLSEGERLDVFTNKGADLNDMDENDDHC